LEFDHSRDYGYQSGMVISKGKLKAKMLEYFREVERTGEPLIVTDHGRSVLEIRPLPQAGAKADILAQLRTQLFGNKTADAIESDLIMEPVWREEDEADDSWWTSPEPAK
jgi:antitoxin (DNA-binding transcriptional repressor) of toxin-antitoxin stability system